MTTRCYEFYHALRETQQQPVAQSRETRLCTNKKNEVLYINLPESEPEPQPQPEPEPFTIEGSRKLEFITDWSVLKAQLSRTDADAVDANTKAIAAITAEEAYQEASVGLSTAESIRNSAEATAQAAVGSEFHANAVIIFVNAVAALNDLIIKKTAALGARNIAYNAAVTVIDDLNDFVLTRPIKNGETVTIYKTGNILIGKVFRNIQGEFIEENFDSLYPFTIEKIVSYKNDEIKKTSRTTFLEGKVTKAQRWSKIVKNSNIRKKKIFLAADKCGYRNK